MVGSTESGSTRREFARRAAIGGAAVWAAPTLVSVTAGPAAAQSLGSTLFGADSGTSSLSVVNRFSGRWGPPKPTGVIPREMTYHSGREQVMGIDAATPQHLFDVDTQSGLWSEIGGFDDQTMDGLAYHSGRDLLYGCRNAQMFRVDPETAEVAELAVSGPDTMAAMAYDPVGSVFYGISNDPGALWRIALEGDPIVWHFLGELGISRISGLAFDSVLMVLWGCSTANDAMYRIDRTSGLAELVRDGVGANPDALAFVP